MEKLLTEVCDIQYGFPFNSELFNDSEGIPLIRIRDVKRGYSETFTTEEYNHDYVVNEGDILIGMDGEFNIAKWGKVSAVLNQRVCRIFPHDDVDADYIFYSLPQELKRIEARTSFATVKHLSAKEINKITIPVPTLEEQRIIAKKITIMSELIGKRKQQLEQLDLLIRARFVELFGDPVSNSYGLPELALSELGELGRGVSKHRPRNDSKLMNGDYPLIQTGDVAAANLYITSYNSTYSDLGLKQSKMWNKGTLCITIAANIAKTAILDFNACFPDSVVGFIANDKTTNIFIHYWFSFFQAILESQAPESAQKNINLKILSELKVIVPDKNKQDEFTEFIYQVNKSKFEGRMITIGHR